MFQLAEEQSEEHVCPSDGGVSCWERGRARRRHGCAMFRDHVVLHTHMRCGRVVKKLGGILDAP